MVALVVGSEVYATEGAKIDSIIPLTLTANTTLVAGTHRLCQGDPTAASFTCTLPDAATNKGAHFFIKRVVNSDNIVDLMAAGSDTIDNTTAGYKLSLINEYIEVYSDGTTVWRIYNKDMFSICTMTASGQSFVVTTSPTKFTSWDDVVFNTPSKLVGNLTTDVIDVLEFQDPVADGYDVNVTFSFEYTNNNTVTGQLFINGALAGVPVPINALGSGKPTNISISQQIAATSVTTIELHLVAENGGTITNINALMQAQRIGR